MPRLEDELRAPLVAAAVRRWMTENSMPRGDRITRVQAMIRKANFEERAVIAAAALRAITEEQALDVCADWAAATDQLFTLNAALLARMAGAPAMGDPTRSN